jgi:hypothetical protein
MRTIQNYFEIESRLPKAGCRNNFHFIPLILHFLKGVGIYDIIYNLI